MMYAMVLWQIFVLYPLPTRRAASATLEQPQSYIKLVKRRVKCRGMNGS